MSFQTIICAQANGEGLTYDNATPIGSQQLLGRHAAVAQGTSNSTAVTSNSTHGTITMFGSLAASTAATFTFTNNKIKTTSHIYLTPIGKSLVTFIPLMVTLTATPSAGSCAIAVYNIDAANAISAPGVNFLILNP